MLFCIITILKYQTQTGLLEKAFNVFLILIDNLDSRFSLKNLANPFQTFFDTFRNSRKKQITETKGYFGLKRANFFTRIRRIL